MPMPYKYIVEMFCDRVAASQTYLGDSYTNDAPFKYFENGKSRRAIHPESSDTLEKMLIMYRDRGDEETFKEIRRSVYKYTIKQFLDKTVVKLFRKDND